MALYIQKYGGSSVADVERIRNVARRIVETAREDNRVLAVVSALGDTTDALIDMAREVSDVQPRREMDLLMSTGEVISSALVAMAITDLGEDAVALTAHQLGIRTDPAHTRARILRIEGDRIWEEFERGRIVVATGFQGITENRDVTTLGRGGSDTSAVALAGALNADRCEIYSDVNGVYTGDPNLVDDAHLMSRISYEEMLEMASLGGQVMQARAVAYAWRYNVDVYVRSSFNDEPGTLITSGGNDMETVDVRAVTVDNNQTRLTVKDVEDKPGVAGTIFGALADRDINVDMIVQSSGASQQAQNDISFTVDRVDYDDALETMKQVVEDMGGKEITGDPEVAQVSVVGTGMRDHPGVAKKVFQTLGQADINIEMISTSEIRISVVVEDSEAERAVRLLHEAFEL